MNVDQNTIRYRHVLFAAVWVVAFIIGLELFFRLESHQLVSRESEGRAYLAVGSLMFVSAVAAFGSLLGHAWRGAAIGLLLFLLFAGWVFFALNTWSGT